MLSFQCTTRTYSEVLIIHENILTFCRHPGCPNDPDGLCPTSTMITNLQKRSAEIDFVHDCYGKREKKENNRREEKEPKYRH
jgi:hypothetical protein